MSEECYCTENAVCRGKYDKMKERAASSEHNFSVENDALVRAEKLIDELKDFAIWMTGCGYDFCQHEYFCKKRDELLKDKPLTAEVKGKELTDDEKDWYAGTPCKFWDETRCGGMPCHLFDGSLQDCKRFGESITIIEEQRDDLYKELSTLKAEIARVKESWDKTAWENTTLIQKKCELEEELAVNDKLLNARNEVLDEIPECPDHGKQCMPHCSEWIRKEKEKAR